VWCGIERILGDSVVPLVIDNFGEPDPTRGVNQPGFLAVLSLSREADTIVKLAAPFRM